MNPQLNRIHHRFDRIRILQSNAMPMDDQHQRFESFPMINMIMQEVSDILPILNQILR